MENLKVTSEDLIKPKSLYDVGMMAEKKTIKKSKSLYDAAVERFEKGEQDKDKDDIKDTDATTDEINIGDISNLEETKEEFLDDFEDTDLPVEKATKLTEAFSTEGFIEFISVNPNKDFSMKNTDEIIDLFEVFKIKDKVISKLKSVTVEEFKAETGLEDFEIADSLDEYINKNLYTNPDMILSCAKSIEDLENSEKIIKQLKLEIKEKETKLSDGGEILSKEEYEVEVTKNPALAKFFGPAMQRIYDSWSYSANLLKSDSKIDKTLGISKMIFIDIPSTIKSLFGSISSNEQDKERSDARAKIAKLTGMGEYSNVAVQNYIKKLTDQYNKTLEISDLKETEETSTRLFTSMKAGLAQSVLSLDDVVESAKNKIKQNIKSVMNYEDVTFEGVSSSQETLSKVMESVSETGIEYLDEKDIKELQELIDEKTKELVSSDVLKSLKPGKGNDVFSALDKTIKSYMEVQKIGSLEGSDIRKIIKDSLQKILADKKVSPVIKTSIKAFVISNKI